jgi:hypothetical protein
MFVSNTYTGFTNLVSVGLYCFYIELDKLGVDIPVDELVEKAKFFNRICFIGRDCMDEKQDVLKFIKKVAKFNTKVKIEIFTIGTEYPTGYNNVDNVLFNVWIQLKNSGIEFEHRIIPKNIMYFKDMNTHFIFPISDMNEVDEVDLIVNDYDIEKEKIFLYDMTDKTEIEQHCKVNGYGFIERI